MLQITAEVGFTRFQRVELELEGAEYIGLNPQWEISLNLEENQSFQSENSSFFWNILGWILLSSWRILVSSAIFRYNVFHR